MKNIIKKILIVLFLLLLLIPAISKIVNIDIKLNGAIYPLEKPELTYDNWFHNYYQPKYSDWLEQNIGLRAFFIKCYNQIKYSVYKQSTAPTVFRGKQDVLFQYLYYYAYNGNDFVGTDSIKSITNKLKLINDSLNSKGSALLYIFAPGKASVYPEFLQDNMNRKGAEVTNRTAFTAEFKKRGIDYIDFSDYFCQIKDTVPYPLFPKGGTHWSGYGTAIAADTIFKFVEHKISCDLVDFYFEKGYITDKNFEFTDNDLETILNLVFPISTWPLYYPKVVFDTSQVFSKPKVLIIGDSFGQSFFGFAPYLQTLFSNKSRFWHNYKYLSWYKGNQYRSYSIDLRNIKSFIEGFDIVLFISTEMNLNRLGYGIIEDLYMLYDPEYVSPKQKRKLLGYLNFDKNNTTYYNEINVDSSESFSKPNSYKISQGVKFSPVFNFNLKDIEDNNGKINLEIEFKYYPIGNIEDEIISLFVEERRKSDNKFINGQAWRLRSFNYSPNKWNNVFKRLSINKNDDNIIKIYIYNNNSKGIYLDNFQVNAIYDSCDLLP